MALYLQYIQRTVIMFFVGIDIAKFSHEVTVIDEQGNTLVKPFKFKNSVDGFEKLNASLIKLSTTVSDFEFGMEATGHYWLNLYTKLVESGYSVHVINPVQSDALRGLYIRQTKNDAKDAFIIAELIRFGRYSETTLADGDLIALRELLVNASISSIASPTSKERSFRSSTRYFRSTKRSFRTLSAILRSNCCQITHLPTLLPNLTPNCSPAFSNPFPKADSV